MRQAYLLLFLLLISLTGFSQYHLTLDSAQKVKLKKLRKDETYTHRKYNYSLSDVYYGFHPNASLYHAVDVFFSDRFSALDLWNFASFEGTTGFSFQTYQGFRLHAGFDYEWLTPNKIHLYVGGQYAIGLQQRTIASNSLSSVVVGSHSYLVPFMGVMWWPGKQQYETKNTLDLVKLYRYPTFWELVYLKAQIGCSALVSPLSVSPTVLFDKTTASNIRQNVSSGLYLSIGAGVNLPTFKHSKLIDPFMFW
jgi:hypothetical protein